MKLKRETRINASADDVWEVLGPQYTQAYRWASSINHSKALGDNGRICDTELGEIREKVELYNEQTKQLAYSAQGEKMPFFVRKMVNTWKVNPVGKRQSQVVMELEVTLSAPFNILMAIPMKMQLGSVLKKAHEELKYYVENKGKAHPRKLAAVKQLQESLATAR